MFSVFPRGPSQGCAVLACSGCLLNPDRKLPKPCAGAGRSLCVLGPLQRAGCKNGFCRSRSAACAVFTFTSDLQMHLQVVNRSTGHLGLKSLSTLFLHTHSGKLSSGRRLSPCSRDGMSAVAGKASCQWLHCGVQDHEVFFKMSSRAYGSHNRTRANEANALKPYAILVITAIQKARHQS